MVSNQLKIGLGMIVVFGGIIGVVFFVVGGTGFVTGNVS